MSWNIEDKGNAMVVTMNSNPVCVMDEGFFSDLNSAFAKLIQQRPLKPVVLSSGGKMFSPGLDLEHCVALFKQGNKAKINSWFRGFLKSVLVVFRHPAPVAAAIEGHAIAGGCILALCCDLRIAEKRAKSLVGLNETSIGFPMPESLSELVSAVIGEKTAKRVIEKGKLYSVEQALENGIINRLAAPERVVSSAIEEMEKIDMDVFMQKKNIRREQISNRVEKTLDEVDSKELAGKLSSSKTLEKLEGLLEILKREKK